METKPKLGLLAGGGLAPLQIIRACQDQGRPFFVFCLEGQAEASLAQDIPHAWIGLGSVGKLRDLCVAQKIEEIVMIGRVKRPSVTDLKPDWLGLKLLAKIGLNSLGDDGLLRNVGAALEEMCGARVIGAHQILADLLAPEGVLTKAAPDEQALKDIALGFEAALALGREDKGQAAIVQNGVVLGLETANGTDELIARASANKSAGLGGVLVKCAKPQQDERFDLPSIGPDTIEALARAGFAGVAIEAGRSLLIERERAIASANERGLFIVAQCLRKEP